MHDDQLVYKDGPKFGPKSFDFHQQLADLQT